MFYVFAGEILGNYTHELRESTTDDKLSPRLLAQIINGHGVGIKL